MTIQAEQWRSDIFSLVDESSVDYQRVGVTIYDQREWSSALPFRLGAHTTTIHKAVPNTNLTGILDHLDAIGEIEWRLFGPFIMQLRGKKMNTDQFIPRPWFHGAGTDIQGARWSPV
ncbi:hypothetical protein V8B97DRAFT_1915739 [Scleroderma yunnanense]